MSSTIIIKIESGVVADVYSTDQDRIIIVDYDLIDGDETCEARMKKAVLSVLPDYHVEPEEIDETVTALLKHSRRPADDI